MPRCFKHISVNELKEKIKSAQKKYSDYESDWHSCWKGLTPQIKKDLSKCYFDLENVDKEEGYGPKGLMGYHTLDNGITLLGISAGGDWEYPVFFIIYWDGKKLRGYIPKDGNPWNTTTKEAYGNSYKFSDGENLKKRFPKLFSELGPDECDDGWETLKQDPNLIKKDIMKRIQKGK